MPGPPNKDSPQVAPKPESGPAMPLGLASIGQEVRLVGVQGGRGLQHRLAEMGLTPGVRFRVVGKGRPGPFIICVKDTNLMLGHGMVLRVLVSPT